MKTVLYIDLVRYTDLATTVEENLGHEDVARLNDQIQAFIDRGLQDVGGSRENVIKTTGDGAILLFEHPDQAHRCAAAVHFAASEHNQRKTSLSAKRYFSMGAASGDVAVKLDDRGQRDIAGITVARAERLQRASKPGQIVVDLQTYELLDPGNKAKYSGKEQIAGKRNELFAARRCVMLEEVESAFLDAPVQRNVVKDLLRLVKGHPWQSACVIAGGMLAIWLVVQVAWWMTLRLPPGPLPGKAFYPSMFLQSISDRGEIQHDEIWFSKLITRLEDDLRKVTQKDGDNGHIAIFRSDPFPYAQSNLELVSRHYQGQDVRIDGVIAFQYRREWLRALGDMEIASNNTLRIVLSDVEAGDQLRVIVIARSKDEPPDARALQFEVKQ
jgi:class 3 adenylate cyclase